MTFAQRLGTTLLIVVTTIGAMFTFLVAGGSGTLDLVGVRVIYVVMAAIALVPWLAVAVVRPSWRPSSRLLPALLLCIAVVAISTITSRVQRLSVEMLGDMVLLVEVYLLLVALMRRPAIRIHFQRLALVMCVLIGAFYLVQALQAWQTWWDLVGHFAIPPLRPGYLGLTIGPNPIATVILLLGSFGLAAGVMGARAGRITVALVGTLVVLTTLITGSRGVWFGAGLGLIAVVATAFVVEQETRQRARALARSRMAVAALAVSIPVSAGGVILAALSGRLTFDDGGYRAGFARASFKMLETSPFTGVGPGTWPTLRAANTIPTDLDLYIPHAHSVYVQTLTEFGLGGALGGIAIVAALGLLIVRSVRSGDAPRRRVGYATLFGVVLLAGQQYADMLMNVPAILLALALPIAWLDASSQEPAIDQRSASKGSLALSGRAVPLAVVLVTIAILTGLFRIEAIAGIATQGVEAANRGDWTEATTLSGEAVADDPDLNAYRFQLGISAANAGDLQLAERALAASTANDDYRYAWLDLAAVRWQLGDLPGAREALARAERLGLQRTALAIAAGWLRQQIGDQQAATEDYAAAMNLMPTLAGDPFWSSQTGPQGGLAPILAAVQQRASPTTMLQIHLVLDQFDLAEDEIAGLSPSDPDLYSRLIPAWQGDTVAWTALQTKAAGRPLDAVLVRWCKLIASYRGDDALTSKYGQWLAINGALDDLRPTVGRLAFSSPQPLWNPILDGYGSLYRRLIPNAQVVRSLPQLILQDHP